MEYRTGVGSLEQQREGKVWSGYVVGDKNLFSIKINICVNFIKYEINE